MQNPRKLTLKQKRFLFNQKMDPDNFLIERTTAESYVFYEKKTGKLVEIRR